VKLDNIPNMKKVLFVANHKGFSKFNAPFMQWFKEQGWRVDNASPGTEFFIDNQFDIDIERSPISLKNYRAFKQLKRIIDANNYDLIHCHTAMGGMLTRLAGIDARKRGTKIFYTAHGFHFFKGAPLKYWLLFFPIELFLSKYTDILITINQEDFEIAQKYKMAKEHIYKIDGVGVNLERFKPLSSENRIEKRRLMGFSPDDFIIIYTAQFIHRKNHKMLIEALPSLLEKIPTLKVIFAGNGDTFESSQLLAEELKVKQIISFLGGRRDIDALCGISDIHVSPSFQEGLPISNIEAMACGCPIVISNIRGHIDICKENKNGFLFNLDNSPKMETSIIKLFSDKELYNSISEFNKSSVNKYSVKKIVDIMGTIYNEHTKIKI